MPFNFLPLIGCNPAGNAFIALMVMLTFSCSTRNREQVQTEPAGVNDTTAYHGKELQKVRMMPYWVSSGQFAGYYVGIEKGIFRKYGIDLEILNFDPFKSTAGIISEGYADFAVLWLVNAIELKANGIDLVNLAQFSSKSSLMLLAKKQSGIKTLQDLSGKKVGIWSGYELQPRALFSKYKLQVNMITIGSTNTLFLLDGVDAINANWFDEYHSIINNGYDTNELVPLFFSDYGLNFLEDGLYCLRSKLEKDPGLCYRFAKATLESWQYVFDHQAEAVDIVIRQVKAEKHPVNRSHQRWMVQCYRELYIPKGQTTINTDLKKADYDTVSEIMLRSKLIGHLVPYDSFIAPFRFLKPAAVKSDKSGAR